MKDQEIVEKSLKCRYDCSNDECKGCPVHILEAIRLAREDERTKLDDYIDRGAEMVRKSTETIVELDKFTNEMIQEAEQDRIIGLIDDLEKRCYSDSRNWAGMKIPAVEWLNFKKEIKGENK